MNIEEIIALYDTRTPETCKTEEIRNETDDFRMVAFPVWNDRRIVVKICRNCFSTVERIEGWRATIEAYIAAGFYCPRIIPDRSGAYARAVDYMGVKSVIFAEEYAAYTPADKARREITCDGRYVYHDDAIRSIGTIATRHIATVDWPDVMCILERFCETDKCDEPMENALDVKAFFESQLPQYGARFGGIWRRYMANAQELKSVYRSLPRPVFQGDLNKTNVLLDDDLNFVGMIDFNLCGRDTLINYLFRESMSVFDEDVPYRANAKYYDRKANSAAWQSLVRNIETVKQTYAFSDAERRAAMLVYEYLRPFWWNPVHELPEIKGEPDKVNMLLDWMEAEQARKSTELADIMAR